MENEYIVIEMSDLSIAIIHPGNRVQKMYFPLKAAGADVELDPPDPYGFDIVLADNADRDLGWEVLKKLNHDSTLVYRMRGDVFHELELWDMSRAKKWAARNLVLPNVDGCIAVCDWLAAKFRRRTGVMPVGAAGLPKRVDDWPNVTHRWDELRASTLTNANYRKKIQPLIDYAPAVEAVLSETGGWWEIAGDGTYAGYLSEAVRDYDHIKFVGYVDATSQMEKSNCMIHLSRLDGQPNGMLEGMASNLPVVTNDFIAFETTEAPVIQTGGNGGLQDALQRLSEPGEREEWGGKGQTYIEENHNREAIGNEYLEYFNRLHSHDS